jgi:hypothetical protein
MEEEIFGPVLTVYVYKDKDFEDTLHICDQTSPYALTGSVFSKDREAINTGLQHPALCCRELLFQRQTFRCGGRSNSRSAEQADRGPMINRQPSEPAALDQPANNQGNADPCYGVYLSLYEGG